MRHLTLISAGFLLAFSGTQAAAQDFQTLLKEKQESRALQAAPKNIPYSYVVSVDYRGQEGGDLEAFTGRYRVNPQALAGSRVTYLNGQFEDFPEDIQDYIEALQADVISPETIADFWCVDDEEPEDFEVEDVNVVTETDQEVVIALSPDDIKDMMEGDDMPKKIRKRMEGQLTLSKPDLHLRHIKFRLTKPTTVKIVAKIKEMEFEQSCELAPNGVPYASESKVHVRLKAFGTSIREDTSITVSDLRPL